MLRWVSVGVDGCGSEVQTCDIEWPYHGNGIKYGWISVREGGGGTLGFPIAFEIIYNEDFGYIGRDRRADFQAI
mgnify:CR=1 FL=1